MLEEAWLHNQHRGSDAAGYFRIDRETSQPFTRKSPQPASDILQDNKEKRILSPATVFGAHTRTATLGDPKDERNNHPVEYGDILITHNGSISNHNKFKNSVPHNMKTKLGKVDSNAIAICLDKVDSPYDIEGIKKALQQLDGSMAVHAIWKNTPGVSLLARGRSSPLLVRFHPDGFFAYSSVDDAMYGMIEAMNMDPNDDAWKTREFNEFSFVIVENGQPIMWSTYKETGWSPALNQLKFFVQRIVGGDDNSLAFETDQASSWTAKAENRSLRAAKRAKKANLIFTQKLGFIKSKKNIELPVMATLRPWDKLTEADLIYENKDANIIYAKFGKTELIIDSDNSKLLDVYNHEKFVNMIRHVEKPKKKDLPLDSTFETWLDDATKPIVNPVKEKRDPLFTRHKAAVNPTKGDQKHKHLTPVSNQQKQLMINSSTKMRKDGGASGEAICEVDIIRLGMEVTWMNIDQYTASNHEPMGFLNDIKCNDHQLLYSMHTSPASCDATILASIAFASCITDVSLWYRIDDSLDIVTRFVKTNNGDELSCNSLDSARCMWEPYLYRQVFIGANSAGDDQVVEVLMGEMCVECGAKVFIRNLPEYMEWWTGDKRYVT